ncbi:hypothetical protein ACN9MB_17475 [Dyella kyungheensis]|uniref:hypothetical protein n=1 Tax=Dyella kyungheensis TaxID=1242174 RepID=UPI003CE6D058
MTNKDKTMRNLPRLASFLFLSLAGQLTMAGECPLDLQLTGSPDVILQQLKALPVMSAERQTERKPLFGHCDYKTSTFMQFNGAPTGMCSVAGYPVIASEVDIVDSSSAVVSHSYLIPKSEAALRAMEATIKRIATPLSPAEYPEALRKPSAYTLIDIAYAKNDDLWIISHKYWEPNEVHSAPDYYVLMHVRRPWLTFALRDTNQCMALPQADTH